MTTSAFAGRPAVIAGGAGGMGQAVTRGLIERGAQVAVLDRRRAVSAERQLSLEVDLTDGRAVATDIHVAAERLGGIELLVCASGVVSEAPLEKLDLAEWRRVLDSSVTATFLVLGAAIPHLWKARAASVCAVSSGWARRPHPRGSHYAPPKRGSKPWFAPRPPNWRRTKSASMR